MKKGCSKSPRVSFVMATNRVDYACEQAIESCLAQTYTDFELLVVANGIDDEMFKRLEDRFGVNLKIRLFRTDIKLLTYSLNMGLHNALGEYIARMDSDDLSYANRLAVQVGYMDRNPEVAVCGTWCDLIDIAGNVVGQWDYPETNSQIRRALYYSNPLCHPSVIYRRTLLLSLGGYNGFYAEDYVTWALMSVDKDIKFANIPEKLLAYRANYSGHQRNRSWRYAKSALAGAQVQLFGMTHNPIWLVGAIYNLAKTCLRKKSK